jgi:hypothetical protein
VFSRRTAPPAWTTSLAGSNAESPTARDGCRSGGLAGVVLSRSPTNQLGGSGD